MDYRIDHYDSGNPMSSKNDFIIIKEKESNIQLSVSESKEKNVLQDSIVIINTIKAELNMTILKYPDCEQINSAKLSITYDDDFNKTIVLRPGWVCK